MHTPHGRKPSFNSRLTHKVVVVVLQRNKSDTMNFASNNKSDTVNSPSDNKSDTVNLGTKTLAEWL